MSIGVFGARRAWGIRLAAGAAVAAGVLLLSAQMAWATPVPGTNLIVNGNFAVPGPGSPPEGTPPADWAVTNLGAETAPYSANIGTYDASGQYPPPAGDPDPSGIAIEDFYEAGSSTGVEGLGGTQTSATFGSITNADVAQVSFSTVEKTPPDTSVAAWAGSGLQVDFTSGANSYSLVYLDPWSAPTGETYSSSPASPSPSTTKYILGPTLTQGTWSTQSPRDLNTDISNQFGLSTFTVNDVRFVELEDATNSGYPYPNMNSYFADIAVTEGSPAAVVPESPVAVAIPLSGVLVMGAWLGLRRRRPTLP
ncbi:MAG TPA: hypothetical protein VHT30_10465 [Acidimicrobiales bacterium]|jgi:hypothetical protein|nr:hypothetical protein [Acidimicrobiales bacterium]